MLAYSRMGRTSVVYARCLVLCGHVRMFLWRKADVVFALCAVLLMWVFQFRVLLMLQVLPVMCNTLVLFELF